MLVRTSFSSMPPSVGATPPGGEDAFEARPAPDRGRVDLWRHPDNGRWFLSSRVSLERATIARRDGFAVSSCALEFDDDGFGIVVVDAADAEPEFLAVDDLLPATGIYVDDEGTEYIDLQPGTDAPELAPVADLRSSHTLRELDIEGAGVLRKDFSLHAAAFHHPRADGCHIMVSLTCMVKELNLDPNSRKGKWIHNMWDSWESFLALTLQGSGVLLKSQPYETLSSVNGCGERVLPFMACTLPSLLALLGRMALASPRFGGLPPGSARREACAELLRHLLRSVCGSTLRLRWDEHCRLGQHSVPTTGRHLVGLRVQADGTLVWPPKPPGVSTSMWLDIACTPCGREVTSLFEFMQVLFSSNRAGWMVMQVCREIGAMMDAHMMAIDGGDDSEDGSETIDPLPGVQMRPTDCESAAHTDVVLEARVMRHLRNCKAACKQDARFFSWAADKARVGSLGLLAGVGVLPSNIAFAMAPQVHTNPEVAPEFVPEESYALGNGDGDEALLGIQDSRQQRHSAWLRKRRGVEVDPKEWQPRKRHRKDVFTWLCQVDHQMVVSTGFGLGHFAIPGDLGDRPPWHEWPLASYAGDQGAVEESGKYVLKWKLRLNFDEVPDPNHGVHNDIKCGLKDSGHWGHVGLMMLTFNVCHGPYQEDSRFHEVRRALKHFFETTERAQDSVLFLSLAERMAFDAGDLELSSSSDVAGEMFSRMKACSPFAKKGCASHMNRFLNFVKEGWRHSKTWTQEYFALLLTCLEQGYLTGSKFKRLLITDEMEAVCGPATNSSRSNAWESSLAKSCQNQLVVATMMMASTQVQRRQRSIDIACDPYRVWFEQQSHELRSVESSSLWLTRQVKGEFFVHIAESVASLGKEASMDLIGLCLPSGAEVFNSFQTEEDDFICEGMADLVMSIACHRLARNAWMLWGWSAKSITWLDPSPGVVAAEIDAFKRDFETFEAFRRNDEGFAQVDTVSARSQFQLMCVEQLVEAHKENGWQAEISQRMRAFLVNKHRRILSSQIVEDEFNRMKKEKRQHANRRLCVTNSFDVVQRRHVVDQVHRYDPVPKNAACPQRCQRVPKDLYEGPHNGTTVNLQGVASFSAATDWYTTTASNHAVPYVDIELMRYALARGLKHKVKDVWVNALVNVRHHILLREVLADGSKGPPLFAGLALPGSVAFGWPASQCQVPGQANAIYFTPRPTVAACEVVIVMLDASMWEALSYKWRSPSWQHMKYIGARGRWPNRSIRAFPTDGNKWKPLLQVAAAEAFWRLPNTFLRKLLGRGPLAPHGADEADQADDQSDMFALCMAAVRANLDVDEASAVRVMRNRLVHLDTHDTDCWDELLNVNECLKLLDRDEEAEVRRSKTKAEGAAATMKAFVRDWRCANELMKAADDKKAKRLKTTATKQSPYPPFPASGIEQKAAATLCPPGGSIWRGLSNGSWQCHLPPYRRRQYSWDEFGFDEACRQCLKHMWALYLAGDGKGIEACPVPGLFTEAELAKSSLVASVASRGASSSSSGKK